jgi:hypothetical protein
MTTDQDRRLIYMNTEKVARCASELQQIISVPMPRIRAGIAAGIAEGWISELSRGGKYKVRYLATHRPACCGGGPRAVPS